jgi:Leucine-rich repeat (LRR) protein
MATSTFHQIEFLCGCTSSPQIYLSSNNFSGVLPDCFANLSQLILLDLDSNQLEGSIPTSLLGHDILESFFVRQNRMSGAANFSAPSLSTLGLSFNAFSGVLDLSSAVMLQILYASHCNFTDG